MNRIRPLVRLVLALAASLAAFAPCSAAGASPAAAPRSFREAALAPLSAVPRWTAPAVDVAALRLEDAALRASGAKDRPPRAGFPMKAALRPGTAGAWEPLPDGERVWRVRVASPGALWLVLGFGAFRPAEGAQLWVYSPDRARVLGPFTRDDERDHGRLWLPPVAGDELVIELEWPAAAADAASLVALGTLSHGYEPWGGIGGEAKSGEPDAGACNIDVNCPAGAAWQDEKRGVVHLLSGGSGYCSGSLIATTARDCRQFVLTAAHCLNSSGEASSTTYQFNFEKPACGSGTAPTNQTVTGSTLRATWSTSDFTLVELNQPVPEAFNAFYNGWTRSTAPATEAWGIHHPAGAPKKISHSPSPLVDGTSYGPDHWRVFWPADHSEGVTEGGSSGSPLFDQASRIVGQLHGGGSSCTASPSSMWDEYGKFDLSWSGGGTASSRLSNWLDPGGTGAVVLDGIDDDYCRVPRPRLEYAGSALDDTAGNADGVADPGETFALRVTERNAGTLGATGVSGTLSTSTPLATVTDPAAQWPDIPVGQQRESVAPHFTVQLDPAIPCGATLSFRLATAALGSPDAGTSDFTLPVGAPSITPVFADDVEAGAGGWVPQTIEGSAVFSIVTTSAYSPTHSWFVNDPGARAEARLLMQPVPALPAGAQLRFWHRFDTEADYDGGVLEYSVAGGPWTDAGPRVTAGGYNSTIRSGASSALAGRGAWSGLSAGWGQVVVELGSLAGQAVQFRWRFAADGSVSGQGWWIDDVAVDSTSWICHPLGLVPGEASDPRGPGAPFTIVREAGGYRLAWSTPTAGGAPASYRLYRTALGAPVDATCEADLGTGTNALLAGLSAQQGFLVVARNSAGEGSYGRSSGGVERPPAGPGKSCP
ncbi:MAG: trypsin-like peptidase domain-containing protein [Acidobacteria bacterium]|nr:trypsin-like peptidase domain-containing protein [Acidobacteriota bacterium]